MSTGFYEHGVSCICKPRSELVDLRLQQRLTAGKLHQLAAVALDFAHNLIECHPRPPGKGELRVAPTAPEITAGSAHEHARQTRIARFALDALIDFGDSHLIRFHSHSSRLLQRARGGWEFPSRQKR